MATTSNLRPPSAFNFTKSEEWEKWKNRFQQFRLASGLSGETEERQVSTLLYCMGEGSEYVQKMTGISDEYKKKYDSVIANSMPILRFGRTLYLREPVLTRGNKNLGWRTNVATVS